MTLQKDGKEELRLRASLQGNADFSCQRFQFPRAYLNDAPYTLSVKNASAGQTCRVEKGGQGIIEASPIFIRIGSSYTYELLSRSTNNNKFITFYESSAPVISGDFAEEGRYVAFVSSASGLGISSEKNCQILWRDHNLDVTKLNLMNAK